jgi:uncharacterized protein YecE (DUF72 family)
VLPPGPQCRIGTSGYQYDHWRGVLYDTGLARHAWFSRYATVFDTVEINNTFYRLPDASVFDTWREQAPAGFLYSLKFSRYGSHLKRLRDARRTTGLFIERAARLGPSLGPILVQLPPRWRADPTRLDVFLAACDHHQRWAVEFRDPDWLQPPVFEILRKHESALCIHDMLDHHPNVITTNWIYLRFHGNRDGSPYSHQFLSAQARRVHQWLRQGLDVFAYFNNDAGGKAVTDALDLKRYLHKSATGESPGYRRN